METTLISFEKKKGQLIENFKKVRQNLKSTNIRYKIMNKYEIQIVNCTGVFYTMLYKF